MGTRQNLRGTPGRWGCWTKASAAAALAAGLLASSFLNAGPASADGGPAITSDAADVGSVDIAPAASFLDIPGAPVGPLVVRTKGIATVQLRASRGATVIDLAGNPLTAVRAGENVWVRVDGLPRPGRVTIAAAGIYVHRTGAMRALMETFIFELATTAPSLAAVATDKADGDHVLPAAGGTVTDAAAFEGLVAGRTYTLTGELMDKQTGTGTGITASTTFVPRRSTGTLNLDFTVPSGFQAKALVAFLTLRDRSGEVASRRDIDSIEQTVSVAPYGTPALPGGPTVP